MPTLTCQRGSTTVLDTFIAADVDTTNFGATDPLQIGHPQLNARDYRRTLLRFDLSGLPAGATITSAILTLHNTGGGSIQTVNTFRARQIVGAGLTWTEGNNGAGSGATWDTYDGSHAWGSPGGDMTSSGQVTVSYSTNGWAASHDLVMDLTAFAINAFALSSHLLDVEILRGLEISSNPADLGLFAASENGTAGNRPTLVVTYITPTVPSKPTLSVVDNADGTGAVATVTGSDVGTTNTISCEPVTGPAFSAVAVRTGDGTAALALVPGAYFGFVSSWSTGGETPSNVINFSVTDASVLYPVLERIEQKIVARLQSITVVNGYNQDISEVRPTRVGGYTPADKLVFLALGEAVKDEAHSSEGNPRAIAWDQTFEINCFRQASDTDPTPVETLISLLRADVEKALTTGANWQQFDGLAWNAKLLEPAPFPTDPQFAGITVNFQVKYRTPETNPYVTA